MESAGVPKRRTSKCKIFQAHIGDRLLGLFFVSALLIIFMGLMYSLGNTPNGLVVSNGKVCAIIGGNILEAKGSAVDAAIATILCEGVLLPQALGIGGGFVATIYERINHRAATIIARERAPAAANENMYVGKEITGAIAAGIPGELLGYWEMHQKFGKLPWSKLFEPTIKLCKEGYKVSRFLEFSIKHNEDKIRKEPTLAEIFLNADGTLPKKGDILKRPQLGKTLEIIAEKGIGELYSGGELAKIFTEDIKELGGEITIEDLQNYEVVWNNNVSPSAEVANGHSLYTTPIPTSGPILGFMMEIMFGLYTENKYDYWQRLIETFKHGFGHRSHLGDYKNDRAVRKDVLSTLEKLTDPNFIEAIRSKIYDNQTSQDPKYYGTKFTGKSDQGTGNIAVYARNGDAVALTSTVNTYFGAKVRSKRTGIILNDEMDDFSTPGTVNFYGVPASPENFIKPGKHPLSSMCPSIIVDGFGDVRMIVGAAGGTKILTSVSTVILKYFELNHHIKEAVHQPRLHHQLLPMRIEVDQDFPMDIQDHLKSIGHELVEYSGAGFSAVTAIAVYRRTAIGAFDTRRDGGIKSIPDSRAR